MCGKPFATSAWGPFCFVAYRVPWGNLQLDKLKGFAVGAVSDKGSLSCVQYGINSSVNFFERLQCGYFIIVPYPWLAETEMDGERRD